MPRQLRIEFEGATYHVMARGNRRAKIFLDDGDRERFLKSLGTACGMCGWSVLAWVLMPNHYHLVVHTPQGNLVEGMRWLQNSYTRYFNTRHQQWGRLFGDRYKSVLVDDHHHDGGVSVSEGGREDSYLTTLVNYVHLNPARARLIKPDKGEGILDYAWSSVVRGYAIAPSKRSGWLDVARGLELQEFPDTVAGRRSYIEELDRRIVEEGAKRAGMAELEGQTLQSTLRRGWYWGSQSFKEKMLVMLEKLKGTGQGGASERVGANANFRTSEMAHDYAEAKARSLLDEGLAELKMELDEEGVPLRIWGDRRCAALAWAIWRQTSVSQHWIARHLGLKSAGNVSQQIRVFESIPEHELPAGIRKWKSEKLKMFD